MKLILKLDLEDINTQVMGVNFMIKTKNGVDVIFSKEAVKEFVSDYKELSSEDSLTPPKFPLSRVLKEGVSVFCDNCGSTKSRVGFFERKCDNKDCNS